VASWEFSKVPSDSFTVEASMEPYFALLTGTTLEHYPATMRITVVAAFASIVSLHPGVITQWDFNSVEADATAATGRLEPSSGQGTATVLGALSHSFGSVASGATSDPNAGDNSQLRLGSFPKQATENKSS
jgi:hypothetical protein